MRKLKEKKSMLITLLLFIAIGSTIACIDPAQKSLCIPIAGMNCD